MACQMQLTASDKVLDCANEWRPQGPGVLDYGAYLDMVFGGWLGKSIGGAIGFPYEGDKSWIDVRPEALTPKSVPPNDDLDLQVLWLNVIEEKGANVTSDDLAEAWIEHCWYPFCEYGIFRRNWRLGIHPPTSGQYSNQLWHTGMGCPIRSEIWGYISPGRPEVAARYATIDGCLDHTDQSIGAEQMFSAMASMAFFEKDIRKLIDLNMHYLPTGSHIEQAVRVVINAYDEGLAPKEARERLITLMGVPEACDARINVPLIVMALLYGENDFERTMLATLQYGYDTDCTAATCGALIGQILGASGIPSHFRELVGDELVVGIDCQRPEMTLSALARDTARIGVLINKNTSIEISNAPLYKSDDFKVSEADVRLSVIYDGLPCIAPGESISLKVRADGRIPEQSKLVVDCPSDWKVEYNETYTGSSYLETAVNICAPESPQIWPMRNIFKAHFEGCSEESYTFGVVGAGLWYLLGTFFHLDPPEDVPDKPQRAWHHHFASIKREYLSEPINNVKSLYSKFSHKIGVPAVIPSYENEINLDRLVGLGGPYCAYLARVVVAKEEHKAHIVIGNTDSFRIYLNGQFIGERDEHIWWTPQNNSYLVTLKEGPNLLLVKLLKHESKDFRFTLGFRPDAGPHREDGQHFVDWHVDLADGTLDQLDRNCL